MFELTPMFLVTQRPNKQAFKTISEEYKKGLKWKFYQIYTDTRNINPKSSTLN